MTVINTALGDPVVILHVSGDAELSRAIVEHGDGRWSLCLVREQIMKQFPKRPVEAECTFTIPDVIETARQAFTGDPAIQHDRYAGKKLAAAVLMFAEAAGLAEAREEGK